MKPDEILDLRDEAEKRALQLDLIYQRRYDRLWDKCYGHFIIRLKVTLAVFGLSLTLLAAQVFIYTHPQEQKHAATGHL